jgi:formylmethanofuran dehydrogenase subunit E
MNSAIQIKKCDKCGIHFIYSKKIKQVDENLYCHECRWDRYSGTAALLAKVIEKMMRE